MLSMTETLSTLKEEIWEYGVELKLIWPRAV